MAESAVSSKNKHKRLELNFLRIKIKTNIFTASATIYTQH
jgi:hypothetical protein